MQGRTRDVVVAACWLAALCHILPLYAGCSQNSRVTAGPPLHASEALPGRALFCPDEYLKWSLRWRGIEAATTEMVVGQPGNVGGHPAIIVYSLSKSSELAAIFREVREELTSKISLISGRPSENNSDTVEDKEIERLDVSFAESGTPYEVEMHGNLPTRTWSMAESEASTDLHGFLAQLRIWDGTQGAGAFALVQNGRSHFRVEVATRGKDSIRTFLGKLPAIRIQGNATRAYKDGKKVATPELREFTLWRSDDERFIPLRFQVDTRLGLVEGTLEDYRPPDISACVIVEPR